jgi:hypothetical protein
VRFALNVLLVVANIFLIPFYEGSSKSNGPYSICWPTMLEADAGGMAIDVE